MKAKTQIMTDPKKMFSLCLSQPRVSAERMRQSILAQNGKGKSQSPVRAS
jgi:hypothetical protein